MRFQTPILVRGFTVAYLPGPANTGRPVVTMNGTTANTTITTGVRWDGYKRDGSPLNFPGPGRQFDHYYSTQGQPAAAIDGQPGYIDITATDGQLIVLGVTWINAGDQIHYRWADRETVGTAVDSTFASGRPSRTLTTPDATETLWFWGTSLAVTFQSGPNGGRVKWSVDGGAYNTSYLELWSTEANTALTTKRIAYGLTPGWHRVTLKVEPTKQSFSGGYEVKYGRVSVERGIPDPSTLYVPIADGEVFPLPEKWKFIRDSASLSLTGGGSALVRLRR